MTWWDEALCAQVGGDFWLPEPGGDAKAQIRAAKRVCAECPVKVPCLEDALRNGGEGVRGGTTARERKALRAAQRTDAS